ncbi:MAG: tRNA epoxyqueuosine(34) reductase QueG [Bacteroidales bacterium]
MVSEKNSGSYEQQIKELALRLGFDACGITTAILPEEDRKRFEQWLSDNRHAGMEYMARNTHLRFDPAQLVENSRSIIVVLYNYNPRIPIPDKDNYRIARYAYGHDYHQVIKKKLWEIVRFIGRIDPEATARPFTDSAPVLERTWARQSGLGWIGKNTCLITRNHGSWFFIGTILTSLELKPDEPFTRNHCGGCTRCIEACPTGALDENGLDARKCISYWTIEHKGESIPAELKGKFNNWIFGCDICQEVCPWNRLAEPHNEPLFDPPEKLTRMTREQWENLDENTYRLITRKSAIKRAGLKGLKRNIGFVSSSKDGQQTGR